MRLAVRSVLATTFAATQASALSSTNPLRMFNMFGGGQASASSAPTCGSFYDIEEIDASGNTVSFEEYRGKVVYIVNVASR
jgi:hypothetical protein